MTEPQPGEVWVITDPHYGPESWDKIHDYGPFIVTALTTAHIRFVYDNGTASGASHCYVRGQWDWLKHATRIWPPLPTWEQLETEPEQAADDLRTQRLAGVA